jgi:hypothetical protein
MVSGTFHTAYAVLFTVQSPYLFTIGHRGIFSLGRWSAQLHTEFHELRATLVRLSTLISSLYLRDYYPLWLAFRDHSARSISAQTPATPVRRLVWAIPISLAATYGIDVSFYSCGYLDVSVPHVRFLQLCVHCKINEFPHSEISGSTLVCQFPGAYRRLPRPSSLLDAKASTIHPL